MSKHLALSIVLALTGSFVSACNNKDSGPADAGGGKAGTGGSADMSGAGGMMMGGSAGMGASAGMSGGAGMSGAGGNTGSGGSAASNDPKDIVDTAVAAGSFKQLAGALTKAGLVDALKGAGPFTVFAPNDDAFAAFEKKNPGVLAGLSTDQLTTILKYHVLSGAAVKSTDLKDGQLAKTLAGPVVAVDLSGKSPKINEATVVKADISAKNGVIHVIDTIILPPEDIIKVATAAGSFTKLAAALTSAGLVSDLQGDGPFTVFAPTDAAFTALGTAPTGDALKSVLLYHVLKGIAGPLDLKNGGVTTMLSGSPVLFDLSQGAKIGSAKISMTNVVAKNGVIHVIDSVIVPPTDDIPATAIAAGNFKTLVKALTDAGLVADLQGAGPFTVFAPTDAAFAALSSVPTGDALKNVLLYHVVKGAVGSGDLVAGKVETLLTGKSLTVDLTGGAKIDDAKVTMANIMTKNGVIHVIDKVLIPK
jgi:transforming growth factor-beta-induced protein